MPFVPFVYQKGDRADWSRITHARLSPAIYPDKPGVQEIRRRLEAVADVDGVVSIERVFSTAAPYCPSKGLKRELRLWANKRDHGNNTVDKGWIELGYIE